MIGQILPPEVAAVEAFEDRLGIMLFPEEVVALGRAVEKRRREFATVRACARDALAQLGQPPSPIVPGLRGAPQWPVGVVGSMTHCAGYRASAVARAEEIVALGIDAEPNEMLPGGLLEVIAIREELTHMAELAHDTGTICWDRLLFSAKESVYKAWFPLTRRWLGFEEAAISVDPGDGTFRARLLVPGPAVDGRKITVFNGRWLAGKGLIVTVIAVTARNR